MFVVKQVNLHTGETNETSVQADKVINRLGHSVDLENGEGKVVATFNNVISVVKENNNG